jgi:hypothetical protein
VSGSTIFKHPDDLKEGGNEDSRKKPVRQTRGVFARSQRQEDKGGEVTITNCVSTDTTWAVREVAATQQLNARAKSDRTYHLLVSLRAGENPDAKTLCVIEERFAWSSATRNISG